MRTIEPRHDAALLGELKQRIRAPQYEALRAVSRAGYGKTPPSLRHRSRGMEMRGMRWGVDSALANTHNCAQRQ